MHAFHPLQNFRVSLLAISLAACLSSCGGGGGSVSTYTPPGETKVSLPLDGRIAADAAGNIYILDPLQYVVDKLAPDGALTLLAGRAASFGEADGQGDAARFSGPSGVALDGAGNVYVADSAYKQPGSLTVIVPRAAIRKITPAGLVTTFAGSPTSGNASDMGSADGIGTTARFQWPNGLAFDAAGNLFVSDFNAATIRKITPAGVVTTFAGSPGQTGTDDGIGASARFYNPGQMVIDVAGNLYVNDTAVVSGKAIQSIRKITPAGVVSTLATNLGLRFDNPGLAINPASGTIYLADNGNILKISPAGAISQTGLTYGSTDTAGLAFIAPNILAILSKRALRKEQVSN